MLVDYALNYAHDPYWALRGEMRKTAAERNEKVIEDKRNECASCSNTSKPNGQGFFSRRLSLVDIAIARVCSAPKPTAPCPRRLCRGQRMLER